MITYPALAISLNEGMYTYQFHISVTPNFPCWWPYIQASECLIDEGTWKRFILETSPCSNKLHSGEIYTSHIKYTMMAT